MKSIFFSALMLLSLTTFVSCTGGSGSDSSPESNSKEADKKLEVGKEQLLEINEYEVEMQEKGFIKFDQDLTTVNNGVMSTSYKIEFTGATNADAYEAKDYLTDYVDMVSKFLSDYPEDQYSMTGRDELKTKIDLANKMIKKIDAL